MANPLYPLAAAIRTVKEGMSANAGYKAFQAQGGAIARATWLRTVAEVRRSMSDSLDEATRPLNRRPGAGEITTISTKYAQRYLQQIDVYVRNKDTGDVESRPVSIPTDALITRGAAIKEAIQIFQDGVTGSPDRFNEQVLGATYTGTLLLQPTQGE